MITFVEGILHDTGNYLGYRYLDTDEIEGNGTRRYYFVSGKIQDDYDAAADLIEKHCSGREI